METGEERRPRALVVGATGLVGREVVRMLAEDERTGEVRTLTRRPWEAPWENGKVVKHVTVFERLDEHREWYQVDRVFWALGTTLRAAGSKEEFRRIEMEYALRVARLAAEEGARQFLLVSAAGANARSVFFYNRVKGLLEEQIRKVGFPGVTIVRPSLLLGKREEFRPAEVLGKCVGWMAPARWRPVPAVSVARALVVLSHVEEHGVRVVENEDVRKFEGMTDSPGKVGSGEGFREREGAK